MFACECANCTGLASMPQNAQRLLAAPMVCQDYFEKGDGLHACICRGGGPRRRRGPCDRQRGGAAGARAGARSGEWPDPAGAGPRRRAGGAPGAAAPVRFCWTRSAGYLAGHASQNAIIEGSFVISRGARSIWELRAKSTSGSTPPKLHAWQLLRRCTAAIVVLFL